MTTFIYLEVFIGRHVLDKLTFSEAGELDIM